VDWFPQERGVSSVNRQTEKKSFFYILPVPPHRRKLLFDFYLVLSSLSPRNGWKLRKMGCAGVACVVDWCEAHLGCADGTRQVDASKFGRWGDDWMAVQTLGFCLAPFFGTRGVEQFA
jgi:hypothetical protein